MTVDLTGIAILVATTVFGVLSKVALAFIASRVKNETMRTLLEKVLTNSLGMIQQASAQQIASAAALRPQIANPLIAVGVRYAVDHAPEALEHFGLTDDKIAEKIEARIGVANIATNLAAAGSALPVVPAPLDPLPVMPAGTVTTADLNRDELAVHSASAVRRE